MNETRLDAAAEQLAERAISSGEDMDELEAMIDTTQARLAAAECLSWTSTILDMEDRLETIERIARRERVEFSGGLRHDRARRVLRLLDYEVSD